MSAARGSSRVRARAEAFVEEAVDLMVFADSLIGFVAPDGTRAIVSQGEVRRIGDVFEFRLGDDELAFHPLGEMRCPWCRAVVKVWLRVVWPVGDTAGFRSSPGHDIRDRRHREDLEHLWRVAEVKKKARQ